MSTDHPLMTSLFTTYTVITCIHGAKGTNSVSVVQHAVTAILCWAQMGFQVQAERFMNMLPHQLNTLWCQYSPHCWKYYPRCWIRDHKVVSNYSPICLLSIPFKLFQIHFPINLCPMTSGVTMSVEQGGNEQVLMQQETETCMYTYSAVGCMKKEERVKGW